MSAPMLSGRAARPDRAQQPDELRRQLDHLLQACVQCGLCLPHCATYLATGSEVQSPRGRLLLLGRMLAGEVGRDDADSLAAFDLCLGCRACATVCPSGISHQLLDHAQDLARASAGKHRPSLVVRNLDRMHRLLWLGRLARTARTLLRGLAGNEWRRRWRAMPGPMRRMGRMLGSLPVGPERDRDVVRLLDTLIDQGQGSPRSPSVAASGSGAGRSGPIAALGGAVLSPVAEPPDVVSAAGAGPASAALPRALDPRSASSSPVVAYFRGCANAALLPGSSRRFLRLLEAAGCRVVIPENQVCCGALARHSGRGGWADQLRARNAAAFFRAQRQDQPAIEGSRSAPAATGTWDVIVVEAAGCSLEWRDYPPDLAALVRDASVLLARLALPAPRPVPLKVAIHDPCHARHGQGISAEPRRLLERVPGLVLLEPEEPEVCCGSGGAYSLAHPELSEAMGLRKAERLAATGADLVVTTNPGCLGQIADGLAVIAPKLPILPLSDLLWYAHVR